MRLTCSIALLCALALADDVAKEEAAAIAKRLASKDLDTRIEATREAAQNQHSSLTSPLIKLLRNKEVTVRLAAVEALGLRRETSEKKRAAKALSVRIKPLEDKPDRHDELTKIVEALHDLAQPIAIRPLMDIPVNLDQALAQARLHAAANIPSKEVIDRLLQYASSGRRNRNARWKSAGAAIRYATQESVKGGIREWRQWWKDNKATFDVDHAANLRADERMKQAQQKANRKKRKRKKKGGTG
ncbi:MAG: HEAT repeat domain-containing protein [Planctomycetota bacterium]|jgi:hypothetical protein